MTDSNNMTCDAVRDQLALLLYGELSFDEEERIDQHLDSCVECRAALDRQRAVHAAIDDLQVSPSPALLDRAPRCLFSRQSTYKTARAEGARHTPLEGAPIEIAGQKIQSWWSQFVRSFEGLTDALAASGGSSSHCSPSDLWRRAWFRPGDR